jgi:prevent-host-death family protein
VGYGVGAVTSSGTPRSTRAEVAAKTIVSHIMVMTRKTKSDLANSRGAIRVQVAELKARLSEYVRRAESGRTVVVTAYGRPVADLVPHNEGSQSIHVHPPTRPWGSVKLPRTGTGRTNSLELLLEERRKR